MTNLLFTQLTTTELQNLINEGLQNHVETYIKEFSEHQEKGKEFLTRKETAEFFGVSVVTIHAWVNDGLLLPFKMGNRTYFKRSHLVDSLLNSNRQAS